VFALRSKCCAKSLLSDTNDTTGTVSGATPRDTSWQWALYATQLRVGSSCEGSQKALLLSGPPRRVLDRRQSAWRLTRYRYGYEMARLRSTSTAWEIIAESSGLGNPRTTT
jgi:hypothetical protein